MSDHNFQISLSDFVYFLLIIMIGSNEGAKTNIILCCVDGELPSVIVFQLVFAVPFPLLCLFVELYLGLEFHGAIIGEFVNLA